MSSLDDRTPPWEKVGQMGRRRFLKLMGQSLALAGLGGCARLRPPSESLPYVAPPAGVTPGERDFYATTLPFRGLGRGVVVESVMGRPIKVDGHPTHPATLGGSDAAMQACLLELYDPDRPRQVTHGGAPSSWADLQKVLGEHREAFARNGGEGLHILTETVTSPSLLELMKSSFPQARWHRYQAFDLGRDLWHYNLEEADLVVSLDQDLLGEHPNRVRLARDYSKRRDPENMNQMWVFESTQTLTGCAADRVYRRNPAEIKRALDALTAGRSPEGDSTSDLMELLQSAAGKSVIAAASWLDAESLNSRLGNVGKTVSRSPSPDPHPLSCRLSLEALNESLRTGDVKLLLILGGDPVRTSGNTLALEKAGTSVHLTDRRTTTSTRVDWVAPGVHPLETWGDLVSYDGTTSLVQPLIDPLTGGWSAYQLLSRLKGETTSTYDLVRNFWRKRTPDFEKRWKEWLAEGVMARTSVKFERAPTPLDIRTQTLDSENLLAVRPDPYLDDGASANNPWLLEMPRPLTRLAWNNALLVNTGWAAERGLKDGDHLNVTTEYGQVTAPIVLRGEQPPGVVVASTGWGLEHCGRFGEGHGYDAFFLRGTDDSAYIPVKVEKVSGHSELISTQQFQKMEGRDLARSASLQEWKADPDLGIKPPPEESLYPPPEEAERRWGMIIDLSKCIGCNACVAACGAENNLSVVGPEQTSRGRAMHWLRVDRYEEPEGIFQPIPCMHCENAPCEQVCPVEATLHNKEGLNQMVYNRCVGTRYCSNNCPYKVRRFNFQDYTNSDIAEWRNVRNPEVTVRSRGVMEKCTYCVQRIEAADHRSRIEERPIADGEVVTACQAACPTRAITFGDLNDPESEVARLAALPHNYGLMAELNTRPRTTYLTRLRNTEEKA